MNNYIDTFIVKLAQNIINPDNLLRNINEDSPNHTQHIEKLNIDLASGIPGILYLTNELKNNYGFLDKDTHVNDYIELLLTILKNNPRYDISLFDGLPGIAMSLVSLKRSDLTNVVKQLNQTIFQLIDYLIEKANVDFINRSSYFDWMYGLAGTLNYLCFYDAILNYKDKEVLHYIKCIQNFFVEHYSQKIKIKGHFVYPWYISREYQMADFDKKRYPFGNYNVSLSHGISGILLALTASQKTNYNNEVYILQKNISNFLLEHMHISDKYPVWPLSLSLDEKFEIISNKELTRLDSWCYGSPGILLSLLSFAEQNKNKKMIKFCIHNLISLNENITGIDSPIICHGYSGNLAILSYIKKRYNLSFPINQDISRKILSYKNSKLKLGFIDKRYVSDSKTLLVSDPGILNGTSGILLSLMLLNHDSTSEWTKIFGFY